MDTMDFYSSELEKAKTTLWKATYSKDLDRAKAARKILRDKKLLAEYVELRIKKQKKAERKQQLDKLWTTLRNLFTFWS